MFSPKTEIASALNIQSEDFSEKLESKFDGIVQSGQSNCKYEYKNPQGEYSKKIAI
jgi:hypothetical protein